MLPSAANPKMKYQYQDSLYAWATEPYGSFKDTQLPSFPNQAEPGHNQEVALKNLYQDEADQGAFIVASTKYEPLLARVTITNPTNNEGRTFSGTIVVREVVPTGSVNSETVPDALPKLDDAG